MRGNACDRGRLPWTRITVTHVCTHSVAGPLFLADLLDPPDTSHKMFSKGVCPTESGFPDLRQPLRYQQGLGFEQV